MYDCLIVGGGVAGLTAGIYTARAGLDTLVISDGESILARNASLENYPGLPAGFDARRYLEIVREQAKDAGCSIREDRVVRIDVHDGSEGVWEFIVEGESSTAESRRIVAASWPDSEYLTPLEVTREQRGSKYVVSVDRAGRTNVDGVYATGRIAGTPHQAIAAAGHGATVGLAVVQDGETPFYHDWVAPEGYFTGRGRDIPPACEEIGDVQRVQRDERACEVLADHLARPFDDSPTMHPSVEEE